MRTVSGLFIFLLCSLSGYASAAKEAPSWVKEAGSVVIPQYDGTVPAVVLLEEQRVEVDPSGTLVNHTRKAVKILTHDGRTNAEATIPYYRGGRRVLALHAWLVAPNGLVKSYDKDSIVDLGVHDEMDLYNDVRFARIKVDNPEVGSVFAYEADVEEKMLFSEDEYPFQGELPVIRSRYVLNLPQGWKAESRVFNHAPLDPVISGSAYTWSLSDLPFHKREEYSPELLTSVPVLAVSFVPNAAGANNANCFRSWADVSRWHTNLSAGQNDLSPEMTGKVRELLAPQADEFGRIRAIAQYVQRIKYVAVEMDLVHGGGYKPHPATLVFNKQYGDCEDKANLMRAMLMAAGIESYLVAIYSGDRTYVRPDWPSPTQFNHMIIAVRVSDAAATGPAVIHAPTLNQHLLIFDPTSEVTPIGDLPWYEQGSFALLMAGDKGEILRMPVLPPEANTTDLTVSADLASSGALTARYVLAEGGQYADHERSLKLYRSPNDYRHHLEALFSGSVRSAAVSNVIAEDPATGSTYNIKAELQSPVYGQIVGGHLLVIGTSLVSPFSPSFPVTNSRMAPIVLRAGLHRKHIQLHLPDGYTVDEMPASVEEQTPWGRFSLRFQQKPGELLIEETVRTEAATLPAEQYNKVKKFFDQVYGADAQEAVLVKN